MILITTRCLIERYLTAMKSTSVCKIFGNDKTSMYYVFTVYSHERSLLTDNSQGTFVEANGKSNKK